MVYECGMMYESGMDLCARVNWSAVLEWNGVMCECGVERCASVNWSARVNRTWRRVVMVYILKIHGISIRISIVEIQVNHPGSDYIYMPGWTWMDLASHRTSLLNEQSSTYAPLT